MLGWIGSSSDPAIKMIGIELEDVVREETGYDLTGRLVREGKTDEAIQILKRAYPGYPDLFEALYGKR